jgi:uncharacterized membrane protein
MRLRGGGGSFNAGSNPSTSIDSSGTSGDGYVTITRL